MSNLWFVTPVYRRFYLTKVCLEQRRRMIDALPFEAHQVVIGDDENLDVARELGFDIVEHDNSFVSAKFNAGYRHALAQGATHCMPIGSDSWLHPSVFQAASPTRRRPGLEDRKAMGIVGLSSFSPNGLDRIDLAIKYPAGFGVGMIYPAHALSATHLRGNAAAPDLHRGIDNSTWARVGKGRVQIEFLPYRPYRYINFHSTEDSITDFKQLRSGHRYTASDEGADPFEPLRELYDDDLIEDMERYYALRSLQVFLTGVDPVFFNPNAPRRRKRYPYLDRRPTSSGGMKLAGVATRYPRVDKRGRPMGKTEFEAREYRKIAKRRGITLTREEELAYRFDQVLEG